ncbi:MAG TPA: RNA 2',3'-cyclic phosphodiesterase [Candidatus Marinimicrobia bacterium]|nr:RNA 2',3'-cyclic phosphodiesterase [Candidatus Neomarinimicrobiota bacterium]
MRIFFGILPDDEQMRECKRIQEFIKQPDDGINWVALENFHITMLFIGESSSEDLERFFLQVQALAQDTASLRWQIHRTGFFSKRAEPKILFAGIRYMGFAMPLLAKSLREAWQDYSQTEQRNSFKPHITLARCRNGLSTQRLEAFKNIEPKPVETVSRELICFESRREGKDLRYIPLKRFILNSQ